MWLVFLHSMFVRIIIGCCRLLIESESATVLESFAVHRRPSTCTVNLWLYGSGRTTNLLCLDS